MEALGLSLRRSTQQRDRTDSSGRTLLVAPGLTTSKKKLLVTKSTATRSQDATRSTRSTLVWPVAWSQEAQFTGLTHEKNLVFNDLLLQHIPSTNSYGDRGSKGITVYLAGIQQANEGLDKI